MSEKHAITKQQIISDLAKSPHGKLEEYLPVGIPAVIQEPEFFAHLIAWNEIKGQIRDAKVALPVIALADPTPDPEFQENAFAHILKLDPRNLVSAFHFAQQGRSQNAQIPMLRFRKLITAYLRNLESNTSKWARVAVQHRKSLKSLYALTHTKPGENEDRILFKNIYPADSIFAVIRNLKNLEPREAAGDIANHRIPFLIALGALGKRAKEPEMVLALIDRMTPTELVTNTKLLERLGVNTVPALRGAYANALQRAETSKKTTFKATRAAENIHDPILKAKLQDLQEKQIQNVGIEGNWLVLGDKSGSMQAAIEGARVVAGTLARMVKGEVHLVFFDVAPRYWNATGKTYEQILTETRRITAQGGTSIGTGLAYLLENNIEVDGIAIVSDAAENSAPFFAPVYKKYADRFGKEPSVYLYRCDAHQRHFSDQDLKNSMAEAKLEMQEFPLTGSEDYYSIPNLAQSMRTNRFSLVDEIMATPLLKLDAEIVHAKTVGV